MAIVVADVPAVHAADDPARALFTLSMLTGVVMLAAGFLRLGSVLRFVSNAVMVGFISAVGVNIILGQLANLTGYKAEGPTVSSAPSTPSSIPASSTCRPWRRDLDDRADTPARAHQARPARAGAGGHRDLGCCGRPRMGRASPPSTISVWFPARSRCPRPRCCGSVPSLLVPALSLAFVGLVQGAAISANFPNPDGSYPDASRDFIGQGAANVIAGVFQGMPVGGSMSASSLNKAAGARSRQSLVIAGVVMAVVILAFAGLVGYIAMPALAGLLILVGYRTIKPADLQSVWQTGAVQKAVLLTTFVLTMVIPLQYAVLVGVGLSVILTWCASRTRSPSSGGRSTQAGPHRDRPAGRASRQRGGRAAAVRKPVLRRRAGARGTAPRADGRRRATRW